MRKKDILLITAVILTIFASIVIFFFDFYNYHFEFKKDTRDNTYVVLKNGRYFEFLCNNDVIDNNIDFTLKPFNEPNVQNTGNMFKRTVLCNDENIEKKVFFERTAGRIKVTQEIKSGLKDIGRNSLYYTHIEYPLLSEVKETPEYIELYDLNCTTTIFKKAGYRYSIIDNFVRIGAGYKDSVEIIFEMKIECL